MVTNLKKVMTAWRRRNDGTTAIEFSLLAVPFVTFVIGIIELSLMFVGNAVLDGAVNDAARIIRTGQLQTTEQDPQEMFAEALCSHAGVMLDCRKIQYEVTTLDHFSDAEAEPEIELTEDGKMVDPPFEIGGVSDVVMIRVVYLYQLLTPMIGQFFSDYPGNQKIMTSTVVIQTEPYDFEGEDS